MKKNNIKYFLLVLVLIVFIFIFAIPKKDEPKESKLSLELNGNNYITILNGDTYSEAGYKAYDSIDGDLTARVTIEGNVNTEVSDKYVLKYQVMNNRGISTEAIRVVKVIDNPSDVEINTSYEPQELTNNDVTIKINISGDGYSFLVSPEGEIIKEKSYEYIASKNDEYVFSIKRKDGEVIEKAIIIDNIDKEKPTGACKNTIYPNKTEVSVTSSDNSGIEKYIYNFENDYKESTNNKYSYNKAIDNVTVTIYDKASNYQILNCIKSTIYGKWPNDAKINWTTSQENFIKEDKYGENNYILYYPKDLNLKEKNALIIFLHGGDEMSVDINKLYSTYFVSSMKKGRFKDAIYLAPQCRRGWSYCFGSLKTLIDEVVSKYNVDQNRIALTGHSHGGVSVFQLVARFPNFFSVAVDLAGAPESSSATMAAGLTNNKIVVYFGSKDSNIVAGRIRSNNLKKAGVNLNYIEIAGEGHPIQERVYGKTNVIGWMIAQDKRNR